jgi:hypothetical protein
MSQYSLDPAAAAELRGLVAEILAEVLPGLSRQQPPRPPVELPRPPGPSPQPPVASSPPMDVPLTAEMTDEWHIRPTPEGRPPARQPGGAAATVLAAGRVPSGVPAGLPASPGPAARDAARRAGAGGAGAGGAGAGGAGAASGADSWVVRIATDDDLRDFALRVLKIADNPRLRRDLIGGRIRFRLAEQPAGAASRPAHRVDKGAVTERAVAAAAKAGARLVLGPRAMLTPLARDKARTLGVPIEKER